MKGNNKGGRVWIACLLVSLIFFFGCSEPESMKEKKKVALVLFVQSNLNKEDKNQKKVYDSILYENISNVVDKALKKTGDDSEVVYIEVCSLNKNTRNSSELISVDLSENRGSDFRKQEEIELFISKAELSYIRLIKQNSKPEGDTMQDIIGVYHYLRKLSDPYKEYDEVRVVLLSDMIHRLRGVDEYPDPPQKNFLSEDDLAAFQDETSKGIIRNGKKEEKIEEVFKNKHFIVSVVKPGFSAEQYNKYPESDIDELWRAFFNKMGADVVEMNM